LHITLNNFELGIEIWLFTINFTNYMSLHWLFYFLLYSKITNLIIE
jgi:hypothetical protein